MFTTAPSTSADLAIALLIHYSFDLSGYSASELVKIWHKQYPMSWLHLAVIEALYQGRYKAISVQQILVFWHRRGQAIFHFNMEFERLICSKFPESLTRNAAPTLPPVRKNNPSLPAANSPHGNSPTTSLTGEQKGFSDQQTKTQESQGSYIVRRDEGDALNISKPSTASRTTPPQTVWSSLPDASQRFNRTVSSQSPIPNQQAKLLPPATHPPIGQFTPEASKRSDSFTSKLKAMSNDKQRRNDTQEESDEQNS